MKKIYLLLLSALFSFTGFSQDLILTGVLDGDLPGGLPKVIEIYVTNDIADLSTYGFGSANNGGGSDGVEFAFSGSATAGDFLYIATEDGSNSETGEIYGFNAFFGFEPNFFTSAAGINGDDAVELFGNVTDDGTGALSGTVIDTFGDINLIGDGTPWDYTDGWAYRIDGTGPDGTVFAVASWTYSGLGGLDGETTNATAANPFPIGTYSTEGATAPTLTIVSPSNGAELDPYTTSVDVVFNAANVDLGVEGNQVDITVNGTKSTAVGSPFAATLVEGTNTILVELLVGNAVILSETVTVTVPEVIEMATIGAIQATGEYDKYYKLTGEAYITFKQAYSGHKYLEDATGAVLIYDPNEMLGDLVIGDGITGYVAKYVDYNGIKELNPVSNPGASSTGNVLNSQKITLEMLTDDPESYESELVTITNVSFTDNTGVFETGKEYPITDPSGNFIFRTSFYDADYIASDIPDETLTVTGIINQRLENYYITARDAVDLDVELPEINFDETAIIVNEEVGTVTFSVSLSSAVTTPSEVKIGLLMSNATANNEFDFDPVTLIFGAGEDTKTYEMTVAGNTVTNADYLVAVELYDPAGLSIGDDSIATVYVLDDETHATTPANMLGMTYTSTLDDFNGAEIVAHDASSQRLFLTNAKDNSIEIIDFSNPEAMSKITAVNFDTYGHEATSVAVASTGAFNGTIAVAVRAEDQSNGYVVLLDTDGNILDAIEVGVLPDMVTFTPDGSMLLVANEGEPNADYDVDPEGTISIITPETTTAAGKSFTAVHLNFNVFDSKIEELKAEGIRIYGPNTTVSKDLEPEYITVSSDSKMAYVSLQENNAIARIDLETKAIIDIHALGYKNHNLAENAFDASNKSDTIFMSTWNVLGMYQPDGIAYFDWNANSYIITANEGDARDYDGYSEEERVKDLDLDPTAYPNAAFLQEDANLGRLNSTTATGDTDGDGDIDQIYAYGARSFSIIDAATGTMVYDSGDWLERIIAEDPIFGQIFNATNDENAYKNRSDDKGPEPEGVIVEEINDKLYAFVGLERIGGVAVFDITDPIHPIFETYQNHRDNTVDAEDDLLDLAPEGVIYIAPDDNTSGKGLIVVANEESKTVSVYTLTNDNKLGIDLAVIANKFAVYPNPITGGRVNFSEAATYRLFDLQGREVASEKDATGIDTTHLNAGIYILNTASGITKKLIIK